MKIANPCHVISLVSSPNLPTMHRIFLPLLTALALAATSAAQSDLLSDPDVEWIGSFTTDCRFDPVLPLVGYLETQGWNYLAIEKLTVQPLASGFPARGANPGQYDEMGLFWARKLNEMLRSGEVECYDDPLLKNALPENELNARLSSLDTIITIDVETYKERISVILNEVDFEDYAGVRIFQQVYLRKSTRSIGCRAVSWAPLLFDEPDGLDSTLLCKPVCWLPTFPAENPALLRLSEDVSYVVVTTTRDQSPALEDITPVKGTVNFRRFFSDFIREPWAPAWSADDFSELTPSDLQKMDGGMDTIIVFNPETFEETITVTRQAPIGERIEAIRFAVRWFYDDRQRRLFYEFVGLAPTEGFYEAGKLIYSKPLFYLKGK